MDEPRFSKHQVVTLLTLVVVALWTVSFFARIWIEWPEAVILDNLMPYVGIFWFASSAISKNGKNGHEVPKEEVST